MAASRRLTFVPCPRTGKLIYETPKCLIIQDTLMLWCLGSILSSKMLRAISFNVVLNLTGDISR